MKYFEELPKIEYTFNDGQKVDCTDLMVRFRFTDSFQKSNVAFYEYTWKDGDTPDKIARYYYGSHDYAWLVMLSGSLFSWNVDLPIPTNTFEKYILKKYSMTAEEAKQAIHHYVDEDGFIVDAFQGGTPVSVYDYEEDLNEKKRQVKLVSKIYLKDIKRELREKVQAIEDAREAGGA